jgi:hypothetical protein
MAQRSLHSSTRAVGHDAGVPGERMALSERESAERADSHVTRHRPGNLLGGEARFALFLMLPALVTVIGVSLYPWGWSA